MPATQRKFLGLGPHGFHDIFYKEWGSSNNPEVLVCAHGLTRNSGDFDYFARRMEDIYRIACPDMPGRGESDWLPTADYNHATYLSAASTLIARLGVSELDWVGTSMGGLMGMILAAQPGTPIRKLVLNDVGAFASRESQLAVISSTGNDDRFNTFQAVIQYLKTTYVSWGKIGDDEWINIAKHSSRKLDDGTYALAYDPNIVAPFKENQNALQDVNIWPLFDAIQVPMLLLHGCDSAILTAEVAQEMKRRNKNLELVDFPGIGHCPSLMEEDQVKIVRDWLQK